MKNLTRLTASAALTLLFLGAFPGGLQASEEALRAHVRFLADDLLEGREAGTDAFLLAARYVEMQFRKAGLEPAGTSGYLQPITFRRFSLEEESAAAALDGVALKEGDEFLLAPNPSHLATEVRAPVVFVGYGVDAPELGRSDWDSVDVKGKIVVYLSGAPASFPSDQRAHYSSTANKLAEAARRGAVATITIRTRTDDERTPWERVRRWGGQGGLRWVAPDGSVNNGFPELQGSATFHWDAAERLFEESGTTLTEVLDRAEEGEAEPRPLKAMVSLSARSRHEQVTSPNVLGMLRGSDPALRDEYVVYTAHLDHVGVRDRGDEDGIHNGAYDNAMGTSILIEVARTLASGPRPKRSIIFAAVTAEEKGLLGASYFAEHPTIPAEGIVANINIDMPLFLFPMADIIAYGAEHSTLGEDVEREARSAGLDVAPDPHPEQVIFVRSDHYPFVRSGVPALYLTPGQRSADPAMDGEALTESFLKENYHRPSDDLSLTFHWPSALAFTRLNTALGRAVANSATRPEWLAESFFGQLYGRREPAGAIAPAK